MYGSLEDALFQLPGQEHKYRCWNRRGHGKVTMESAITTSCDVYFYELAVDMGIDKGRQHRNPPPIQWLQAVATFTGRKDGTDTAAGHRQDHIPPGAGPTAVQEPAAVKSRRTIRRRPGPWGRH